VTNWSDWEVIRRQVAVCGAVRDSDGKAVASGLVSVYSIQDFSNDPRRDVFVDSKEVSEGTFHFVDLPNGKYRVEAVDTERNLQGKSTVSVTRTRDGSINRAITNLTLTAPES
jgi:hypothetical protein